MAESQLTHCRGQELSAADFAVGKVHMGKLPVGSATVIPERSKEENKDDEKSDLISPSLSLGDYLDL